MKKFNVKALSLLILFGTLQSTHADDSINVDCKVDDSVHIQSTGRGNNEGDKRTIVITQGTNNVILDRTAEYFPPSSYVDSHIIAGKLVVLSVVKPADKILELTLLNSDNPKKAMLKKLIQTQWDNENTTKILCK